MPPPLMMLHSCALLGIDTVTANAVPSAVVLVGKFINHQNPHFTIPPPVGRECSTPDDAQL